MFESKSGVFLIAGVGFFALAFASMGVTPWLMYGNLKEETVEEMVQKQLERRQKARQGPNWTILDYFKDLQNRYPESFDKYIGPEASFAKCVEAIRAGHKVYVAEACWHCHSQFVRDMSNEDQRWGPVAQSWEYQNELQKPVLFGTRRVGPDLSREGGRRSSDWHALHFYRPRSTSPRSVMPDYPWFFDGDPGKPNDRGLALITYVQFLGSWLDGYPTMVPANLKIPKPSQEVGP